MIFGKNPQDAYQLLIKNNNTVTETHTCSVKTSTEVHKNKYTNTEQQKITVHKNKTMNTK